jgi:hypothetical protein
MAKSTIIPGIHDEAHRDSGGGARLQGGEPVTNGIANAPAICRVGGL